MSITTVTGDNLADYIAERTTPSTQIRTGDELVAAVEKAAINPSPALADDAVPKDSAPRKGRDVQDRINELTRQRKEAEAIAEDLYNDKILAERKLSDLLQERDAAKTTPVAATPENLAKPDPKDFTDIGDFTTALLDYSAKVMEVKIAAAEQLGRARAQLELQNVAMAERVERARAEIEDFQEVIEAANGREVPSHIQEVILESDVGPWIAYHLAKNPAEEQRLFKLSATRAVMELGLLAARFDKSGEPKAPPTARTLSTIETTRAPAPVQSFRAESGVIHPGSIPKNFDEYKVFRNAQRRAKTGR
jgi:hypothetical protein